MAPHITLEWIGEPFELHRVEREQIHAPEFLAINSLGKVPALLADDQSLLVEASAILLYLADLYPDKHLGAGAGAKERYEINQWMSHFGGNVHPVFFPFFVPMRYTNNPEHENSVREAAFMLIDSQFAFLEEKMKGKNHVVGDRRTIADPYLFVFLRWGNHLPKPLSDYPNLHRFFLHMAEDEGVKRALAEQRIGL